MSCMQPLLYAMRDGGRNNTIQFIFDILSHFCLKKCLKKMVSKNVKSKVQTSPPAGRGAGGCAQLCAHPSHRAPSPIHAPLTRHDRITRSSCAPWWAANAYVHACHPRSAHCHASRTVSHLIPQPRSATVAQTAMHRVPRLPYATSTMREPLSLSESFAVWLSHHSRARPSVTRRRRS